MKQIMEKVKSTKILAIIGIILAILGTLIPYAKIDLWRTTKSFSLIQESKGWFILAISIIQVLICLHNVIEKYIPKLYANKVGEIIKKNQKVSIIPTIIILIITILEYNKVSGFVTLQLGFYLLILSCISMLLYPFIYKNNQ